MISRRTLLRSGTLSIGAAVLDLSALAGPAARTRAGSEWAELDRNENPWGPAESAQLAMIERLTRGNRYLDSEEFAAFGDQLGAYEKVSRESIVFGAGSNEILWMTAAEFLRPGSTVVLGDPTYELIGRVAGRYGADVEGVPVTAAQVDDLGEMAERINAKTKLVYVCNPNNPCGSAIAVDTMRSFVLAASKRVPVLVDEAYLDYEDPTLKHSMVDLVRAGENVIVARTFSKIYGLAGMRLGYAVTRPDLARRLSAHRFSAVNSLVLAGAAASLRDRAFVDLARKRNAEGRAVIAKAFDEKGIRYIPSVTNFLWFDESGLPKLAETMREQKILIPSGRFAGGWNRVTIGTSEEVARFADVLRRTA